MAQDKVKSLYDTFVKEGYEMESEADFRKNLSDPTKRKAAYDALLKEGYEMEAYDKFENNIGFGKTATTEVPGAVPEQFFKLRRGGKDFLVSTDEVNKAGGLEGWARSNQGAPLRVYMQGADENGKAFSGHVALSDAAKRRRDSGYKYSIQNGTPLKMSADKSGQTTTQSQQAWKPTPFQKASAISQAQSAVDNFRSTAKAVQDRDKNIDTYIKKGGSIQRTPIKGDLKYNPESGKLEQTYITPAGTTTADKAVAERETRAFNEYVDNMTVAGQLRRAGRDLQELHRKRNARAQAIHDEWAEDYKKNKAPLASVLATGTYRPSIEGDQEYRALTAAIHQAEKRVQTLQHENDRQQGKDVGFWRGFGEVVGDIKTWDFGYSGMMDAMTMLDASKPSPKARPKTEGQKAAQQNMLEQTAEAQAAQAAYGQNDSFWHRAGVMTGEMLPFMLDFALMGGSKSGSYAVTRTIDTVLLKTLHSAAPKVARKKAVQWTVKAIGAMPEDLLFRAPLMTNTVQGMKTASDIIDRKLGDVVVREDGSYDFSNDKKWSSAIWQGEANNIIENYSEMFGTHLDGLISLKNASKVAEVLGAKRLSGILSKASSGTFNGIAGTLEKHFNNIGISDYLGEVGEEYYGQLWRTMLNLDDAYKQNPDGSRTNLFLDGQFHGDILGGMALSMGLIGAGKYSVSAASYGTMKHRVNKADKLGSIAFSPDKWEAWREKIDSTPNTNVGELAELIAFDESLSEKQREAALTYLESSLNLRGFNLGSIARERNSEDINSIESDVNLSWMDGYSATTPQEMNDARRMFERQRQRLASSLSEDEVTEFDTDPIGKLSELTEPELMGIASDYVNAKQVYDGMIQRVRDDIDSRITESDALIDSRVNRQTGKIQPGVMKVDDREVYIISGNVKIFEDGSDIDLSNSDKTIIIKDAETGKVEFTSPDKLRSLSEAKDPESEKVAAQDQIRNEIALTAANNIDGVLSFSPGETYSVLDLDGNQEPITVLGNTTDENGMPRDGYVDIQYPDNSIQSVATSDLQQWVDAANEKRIDEFEQERGSAAEEAVRVADSVSANAESVPDSTENAVSSQSEAAEPITESEIMSETDSSVENVQQSALAQIPLNDKGKPDFTKVEPGMAWDALVEKATNEQAAQSFADNMVKRSEEALNKAEKAKPKNTDDIDEFMEAEAQRQANIDYAKATLDHWKKIAGENQRRKAEVERQREAEARRLAEERAEAEKAARAAREEAARREREALEGIPEWHRDTPENARARGTRRYQGQLITRQEPVDGVAGKEVEVKFSNKDLPQGRVAVIEASQLQPSHIQGERNPLFFIDEAQPKNRSEAVSAFAAKDIAENIRPEEVTGSVTAYSGAPTVNARCEVIQGNNRSDALRYLWENKLPEQQAQYKQYLLDNAEQFGIDRDALEAMEHPVLVNMLNVDDAEAIRLGQMTAQDTESGGIERIKPKNVAQKLGDDMQSFAARLLHSGDEEASFGQLVDRNGVDVLKWMSQKGVITNTQYQSAFDSKGNLTPEAKNDLQKVLYQAVFRGASQQLEEMFDKLPAKAQRAILSTAFRDMDSPLAGKMLPEIQASVVAYSELMNDASFANAKKIDEVLRAVESFKQVIVLDDRFEQSMPADNFSNFALHLAALYKAGDMSQTTLASYFNQMYDLAQGKKAATLFEEADTTEYPLADVIKQILGIDYKPAKNGNNNVANGDADVALRNQTSQGGELRGNEPPASGEQNPTGEESSERGGGTVLPVTERGRQGNVRHPQRRQQDNLPQTETNGLTLSEETDHNDLPLLTASDGTTTFGVIREGESIQVGVIKLSLGFDRIVKVDGKDVHRGYGYEHIDAQRGDVIRAAGFSSVADFVEYVSKNYTSIKKGGKRNGKDTFIIEVPQTDGKDTNVLYIELSADGEYWNVNSGGIFRSDYTKNKEVIAKKEKTDNSLPALETSPATVDGKVQDTSKGGNLLSGNSSLSESSERKVNNSVTEKQESGSESSLGARISEAEEFAASVSAINPTSTADAPVSISDIESAIKPVETEISKSADNDADPKPEKKPSKWVDEEDAAEFERLRKIMRNGLGQLNMGFPPELLYAGAKMSYLMMKHGVRKFAEYAAAMIEELGDAIRPHLKALYNFTRSTDEVTSSEWANELTPFDEVMNFDTQNFDKSNVDAMATAENVVAEEESQQHLEDTVSTIKETIRQNADGTTSHTVNEVGEDREEPEEAFNGTITLKDGREAVVIMANHTQNIGEPSRLTDYIVGVKGEPGTIKISPNDIAHAGVPTAEDKSSTHAMDEHVATQSQADRNSRTDKQGNPTDEKGRLIVDIVKSVEELTDGDFMQPSRNVGLPKLPQLVSDAIGANGRRPMIKKNIFEKNRESHKDLTAEDSRKILNEVLYNPDLYGQNQKEMRPYNWIMVHLSNKNSAVVLELNPTKIYLELVNWHYLNGRQLEQKKRQAEREGGRILTLSADNAVGNTSLGLSFEGKDNKKISDTKEQTAKKREVKPEQPVADLFGNEEEQIINDVIEETTAHEPKPEAELSGDSAEYQERARQERDLVDDIVIEIMKRTDMRVGGDDRGPLTMRDVRGMLENYNLLTDISATDLQELVERAMTILTRKTAQAWQADPKKGFDRVVAYYNTQPSLNARDSERLIKQQYSTPTPFGYVMGQFVNVRNDAKSILEPSAGNGALTIMFDPSTVHVNDIDERRLENLRTLGYGTVTAQNGLLPFEGVQADGVLTNPPFGVVAEKKYDGVFKISSLEGQMAINALDSMKDGGRAAIIIGGNTSYRTNGSMNPKDAAFFGYLYSHYNVVDVINISGKALYARNGTGYDVRMILINGRKTGEFSRVYPPVKSKARAEQVTTFDELYKRVQDDIQQVFQMGNKPADVQPEAGTAADGGTSTPDGSGGNKPNKGTGQRPGTTGNGSGSAFGPRIGQPSSGNAGSRPAGVDNGDGGNAGGTDDVQRPKPATSGSNGRGGTQNDGGGRGGNGHGAASSRPNSGGERLAVKPDLTTEKVPYPNQSDNGFTLLSVVPAAQAEVLQRSLGEIGDVDQFLVDELGYSSKEELYGYLAAEQIDSVALAIHQMNKGNAFIIGDMTGVGKGRQGAALIRYGVRQGRCPIYFTQKPTLFTDNYRDLADIGSSELRPFIIASNPKDANIVDANGKVVHKLPSKKEQERVFNYIMQNGKLPKEYDYVLTTYDQIKNGTADYTQNEDGTWNTEARKLPKKSKGYTTADYYGQARRDALARLAMGTAPGKGNIAILDESHTVGGDSGCGRYMQMLTSGAYGVTFLSATFAKRADNMPIYAQRTAIAEAGVNANELIEAIAKGGVTLQEIMSKQLVESGQMIRRERSFEGVTIDWLSVGEETNRKQREQFNEVANIFNSIRNFQNDFIKPIIDGMNEAAAEQGATVGQTQGTKDLGVRNTPFASKMYNLVNQLLFALKVDAVADRVIENLRNGFKPVISFTNTMEGFLASAPKGVAMDEVPNFSLTLMRALDGVMRFTENDADQNSEGGQITLSQLSPEGQRAYNEVKEKIMNLSADLPISPMDAIRMKIEEAGYSVAEITGRTTQLNRTEDGRYIVEGRKDRDKKAAMRDFNAGKLDVLMINKSGSTGISLHASSKFEDQRQRVMVFAQFQSDINDEVQMRGRIDRSGQVVRGRYEYIMSTIPAEQRIQMMFKAKLKSLDANTTSSQKSKFNEMEIVDYLNKYGDEVVWEYMKEHPELSDRLGDPLKMLQDKGEDGAVRTSENEDNSQKRDCAGKISRYLAFLSVEEQDEIFKEITEAYKVKIQLLDDAGENDLEITTMPLRAETKSRQIWHKGENPGSGNAFADNTYVEEVEVDVLKKPMKRTEIEDMTRKLMGDKVATATEYDQIRYGMKEGKLNWGRYSDTMIQEINSFFSAKADDAVEKMKEAGEKRVSKAREKAVNDALKARAKGENTFSDQEIESLADVVAKEVQDREEIKQYRRREEINNVRDHFKHLFSRLRAGHIYVIPQDLKQATADMFTQTFGTFVGFKFNKSYTLGSSTAIFATLDGRRKVELALNDKAIDTIIRCTDTVVRYAPKEINAISMDNWDSKVPTQTRQKRYIITGNLLQALVDTEKGEKTRGNLISFSTMEGDTRQGILMSENFKPTDLRSSVPLRSRLKQIQDGMTVVGENGDVQIERVDFDWKHRGDYELRVPKSKQRGGIYTMHPELLKVIDGHNFNSKGNHMVGYVSPVNLAKVVDMLSRAPFNLTVLEESKLSNTEEREIRYRFAEFGEDFDAIRNRAVEERGIVMPGLSDKKVRVVEVPRHGFTGTGKQAIEKARVWAKNNLIGEHKYHREKADEFSYTINEDAIDKYLSSSSTKGSDNLGVHLAVLKKLREIIDNSIQAEIHPDYAKKNGKRRAENGIANTDILVHRFYGSAEICGVPYRIKTTIKEHRKTEIIPYNYQVTELELLISGSESSDALSNSNFISAAKLLKGVEKSYDPGTKLLEISENRRNRSGDGAYSDEELSLLNDPGVAIWGRSMRTKKQREEYAARERARMRNMVTRFSDLFGVDINVIEDVSSLETIPQRRRKAKGWYDIKSGKITVVMGNHRNAEDLVVTILHEAVAHHGLRELFGSEFDKFLDAVYEYADNEVKERIDILAINNGWNRRTGTEEYLARLAEDTDFEEVERGNPGWFMKIKDLFLKFLRYCGFNVGMTLSDNELRYVLWMSYKNLQHPGSYRSFLGQAERVAKEYELKVGEYSEKDVSPLNVAEDYHGFLEYVNERFNAELQQQIEGTLADGHIYQLGMPGDILRSTGVPELPIQMSAARLLVKATEYGHDFYLGEIRNLVKELQTPMAIFAYGDKGKMQNIIVGIESNGKQFIVGLSLNPIVNGKALEINSVRNVFPKNNAEWLNWISQGKLLYADKQKIQDLITKQRTILADVDYLDLDDVAKIVKEFENPATEDDILYRDGDFSPRDNAIAADWYEKMLSRGGWQFREAVQDSMLGLKTLYEGIMTEGDKERRKTFRIEDIPGYENAYLYENRMSSANNGEQQQYFIQYMKPLLKSVHDLCGNDKVDRQALTDYMMAKHGLERNEYMRKKAASERKKTDRDFAGLCGLTGEDDWKAAEVSAQQMVDDYEKDHDTSKLWENVKRATDATLEKIYLSGLISDETYEKVLEMYDHYIPLRGWDDKTSDQVYGYLTSNDGPLMGNVFKGAKGHMRKADDPIATIAKMADDAIRQGNRNIMKQRFLNFVHDHPSDLVSINKIWLQYDDVTDEWKPVFADLKQGMTPAEVDRTIAKFESKMESDKDKYKRGRQAKNISYIVKHENLREHQVLVKRNGVTYVLTINGNPRAAQALNGLTNPDVETGGAVGNLLKLGENINRQLSAFYTTRNPDFVMGNFLRDMLYSNCMTWVKEDSRYSRLFLKNVGRVNPAILGKLLYKWENGNLDSSNDLERMFKEFMLNGGETGYTSVKDIEGHKRTIAKELKKQGSVGRKAWTGLNESLDLLNRSVENCARFAAFVTSRQMGRTIDRSIYDAKEISVNFNKKGSGGKFVNATGQKFIGKVGSYIGGGGRILFLFWNAGTQGLNNFIAAGKRNPKKAIGGVFAMFALGAIVSLLHQIFGGGGDDDDKNAYFNLPEYIRRSNICIRIGKQFITIPLPIEFRAIYGLGELAAGVISRNEIYSISELALQLAGQVSQIMPLDMLEGGGGFAPFIPSAVKPLTEAYIMNKGWTGLPVYKNTPFNKNDPEWKRVYQSTDQHLVDFSRWLNATSGGDDFKKGSIDINPAKIEYLLNGTFGGLISFPMKTVKFGESIFGDREFEWKHVPFVNRVIKAGDERTAYRKLREEYYKYYDELQETKEILKKYEKAKDDGILGYAQKVDFMYNSKEYLRYVVYDDYFKDRIKEKQQKLKDVIDKDDVKMAESELYDEMRNAVEALRDPEKFMKELEMMQLSEAM